MLLDNRKGLHPAEIKRIGDLLPHLAYADGLLTLDGVRYDEIWDGGGPLLVYLPERAVANLTGLRRAFSRHFDVGVHFALKSCYVPDVAEALRHAGAGVEVMSAMEWRLAGSLGFAPGQVIANSPGRTAEHRRELIASGAGMIGVDSLDELERVEHEARAQGARPRISLRINTLADPAAFFTVGSKLGADLHRADELIAAAQRSPSCEVVALHAHQLRHCTDPGIFHDMVRRLGELARDTAPGGRPYEILNLGGGLEARFLLERHGHTALDFADAAREALSILTVQPSLRLEPGRYVVGDAAIAFSQVVARKHDWLISEISSNVLIPLPDLAYHPLPLALEPDAEWAGLHVGDATCAPSHLCKDAVLPESVERAGFAVLNCGAYTSVYAELWAFPLPRLAVFAEGAVKEIFGPKDEAQMFRALYGRELR